MLSDDRQYVRGLNDELFLTLHFYRGTRILVVDDLVIFLDLDLFVVTDRQHYPFLGLF